LTIFSRNVSTIGSCAVVVVKATESVWPIRMSGAPANSMPMPWMR
jgi:hypothetical protein